MDSVSNTQHAASIWRPSTSKSASRPSSLSTTLRLALRYCTSVAGGSCFSPHGDYFTARWSRWASARHCTRSAAWYSSSVRYGHGTTIPAASSRLYIT